MDSELTSFRAGDSVSWTKTSDLYPPSDGWAAKYHVTSAAGKFDVSSTVDSETYLFTITSTASTALAASTYSFVGYVEKGSGAGYERHTLWTGSIEILPNLAAETTPSDRRSFARQSLEKVEAAIKSYSTRPVREIEIAGRRIVRPSLEDLMKLRSQLILEVQNEENTDRINQGLGSRKVLARLGPTS
jgi:hypothetical protein